MTTTNVHAMTPDTQAKAKKLVKEGKLKERKDADGAVVGYIATLQSKRAWDALVHGNMS